jgi:hypothetical protein
MKSRGPPAMPGKPGYLLYEDTPRYDALLKLILVAALLATLIPGIVLFWYDTAGALAMLGVTALDALIFYFVMPKRYQLYDDRVRIVLGGPFGMDIRLSDIKEARPSKGSDSMAMRRLKFATSSRTATEIIRRSGWSVVISPSDREVFLERLNEVLETARGLPRQ